MITYPSTYILNLAHYNSLTSLRIRIASNFNHRLSLHLLILAEQTGDALCDMGQCLNGGTCIPGLDNFNCSCRDGYYGMFCEMSNDICGLECFNDGTCVESLESMYYCMCPEGWTGV